MNSNPENSQNDFSTDNSETFGEILSQFQKSHSHLQRSQQLQGTVISVTTEAVFFDIGYKSEGILALTELRGEDLRPGDKLFVSVKGRDADGYYELSRFKAERAADWSALEKAFAEKSAVLGTVTAAVKGGFSVDVGVRAFMPASRSGASDASQMAALVGQEIRCRITKLDVADEDVVVDRRALLEEEQRATKDRRYSQLQEGETLGGVVRSLTDYGAFIDIGGIDALLHVGDISWSRISKPVDALSVGQQIEVKILKISAEGEKRRISVGIKQLQPHPWDSVSGKYKIGDRVRGTVTRLAEFGAFVEIDPGVEGLIHVSEMSWAKSKVRKPSDVVKQGDVVEAIVLSLNPAERRMALGLKQALGDPWADASEKFPIGSSVDGPVTTLTKFGAFVQIGEGLEGMIHVSDISAEKRINQPADVLRVGQMVRAQILALDPQKRQIRLGMKQLVPTGLEEYIAEHKAGDTVTGRLVDDDGERVELGDGIYASCKISRAAGAKTETTTESKADISSLTSMLQARWNGASPAPPKTEPTRAGQVRSFRIVRLDPAAKTIELEFA